jgi:hypothetical protein
MPATANIGGTSDSWESRCKALIVAFRKLQIREDLAGPPFTYDLARELMLMSVRPPAAVTARGLEALQERGVLPNPKKPTRALEDLAAATERALEAFDSLPQSARDALYLREDLPPLKQLRFALQTLHLAAALAAKPKAPGPGAPPREIARAVARHYEQLTGKRPTVGTKDGVAYGPFLNIMREVFAILGVDASAEVQARAIAREWNTSV